MKNYKNIITVLLLASCVLLACKKDLKTYDGEESIYFLSSVAPLNKGAVNDSMLITFAYAKPNLQDSTVKLSVRIAGSPVGTDREFKLVVDPASTAQAGIHYSIGQKFVIPANEVTAHLDVKLKRTAEMRENNYTIIFKLEDNQFFKTPMKDRVLNATTGKVLKFTTYSIWINDILRKPKAWQEIYLGTFSRKKMFLLSELLEIPDLSVLDDTQLTPIPKRVYYATFMQRYLNEMKAAGKTIYDENGSEMIMGAGVQ